MAWRQNDLPGACKNHDGGDFRCFQLHIASGGHLSFPSALLRRLWIANSAPAECALREACSKKSDYLLVFRQRWSFINSAVCSQRHIWSSPTPFPVCSLGDTKKANVRRSAENFFIFCAILVVPEIWTEISNLNLRLVTDLDSQA